MSAFQVVRISSFDYEETDRAIINLESTTLDRPTATQCLQQCKEKVWLWDDLSTTQWAACDIALKNDTAILTTKDCVYYVWLI